MPSIAAALALAAKIHTILGHIDTQSMSAFMAKIEAVVRTNLANPTAETMAQRLSNATELIQDAKDIGVSPADVVSLGTALAATVAA